MSTWCWVISPFYDFCCFWSMAVSTINKLQFLSFIFAVLLSVTAHFSTGDRVWKAQTHQRDKCHQNRSSCCGYIAIFRIFKMAVAASLDFLKYRNFIGYWGWEGQDTSACQISSKSVNRLRRYCDFSIFQDGGHHHLGLLNLQIFIGWRCLEGQTHHCTKFCRNQSFHWHGSAL